MRVGIRSARQEDGGATGATGTVREYIWLPETEIVPTAGSRTTIDRPLAVVDLVNTASPQLYWVSVDHLNRPVKMTNASRASVWDAVWLPWGGVHSITGSASLDTRFPGQWFQAETGLHYNWHRSYDPTLGRYTRPDPLGFVDGPSVYGYVGGSPQKFVDRTGRDIDVMGDVIVVVTVAATVCIAADAMFKRVRKWIWAPPANFNCRPGFCCNVGESAPKDNWGGKICHYVCGADDRKVDERQSSTSACRPWILDDFNQGLLGP